MAHLSRSSLEIMRLFIYLVYSFYFSLSLSNSLGARSILSFMFAAICEWVAAISIKQRAQQRRLAVWHTRCGAAAAADADVASRPQAAAQLLHDSTTPLPSFATDSADKSNGRKKCRQLMPQFISSATRRRCCAATAATNGRKGPKAIIKNKNYQTKLTRDKARGEGREGGRQGGLTKGGGNRI